MNETTNSVKLYSNGTAVITKGYKLNGQPVKVAIPVKKGDLDDVVSSIAVLGNVSYTPPAYAPTNAHDTTLNLDSKNVLRDLAQKLRGAEAEIMDASGQIYKGRVYGTQVYQQETQGSVFDKFRLLLGTDQGVRQFEEANITSLRFTDPLVQAEIDKSLQASFNQIKPDSRTVELTLNPNDGASEAAVSYATPVAAWKVRYQLRLLKGAWELNGQAVVDNDTDDNWNDVVVSVVTGEPISFATDIADIRRPARSKVNVVSDVAQGAVNAEDVILAAASVPSNAKAAVRSRAMGFMGGPAAGGGMPGDDAYSLQQMASGSANLEAVGDFIEDAGGVCASAAPVVFPCLDVARQQDAEVREAGDSQVYTSPNPVTIRSKQSAIINLFNVPVDDARPVLLYKPDKNPRRPFRAVKFKAPQSLGKGVLEVYMDTDRQGKAVLEAVKAGDDALIVHALETGVKVFKLQADVESRRVGLRIKEGVAYCEQMTRLETTYKVQSSKPEKFSLDLEHARTLGNGSRLEVSVSDGTFSTVDTPSGQRISTELEPNGTLVATVTETLVQEQQYLVNPAWLQQNIVIVRNPLTRNKGIQKAIELQEKVDNLQRQINDAEREAQEAEEEQERLLKLIPGVHQEQANKYRNDVAAAEDTLRKAKKQTLPDLRNQIEAAKKEVREALNSIKASWSDEEAPKQEEEPAPAKV